jgi:hypothetical protein
MDPLRCGAGEAGAFHPLYEALQNNTGKNGLRQLFLVSALDGEAVWATVLLQAVQRRRGAENVRKSWGLNSLLVQGSLRIPLRLVLRPAQEVRTSRETNKNLLPIT